MESPQKDTPRSLKAVCEAIFTISVSEGAEKLPHKNRAEKESTEVKRGLELLFSPGNSVLHGVPAVKGLREAVRLFVRKHAQLLNATTGNAVAGATNAPLALRDAILRSNEAMAEIREEWKQILERMYTVAEEQDSVTPPGNTLAADATPLCNVLRIETSHDESWEELPWEGKLSCDDARALLDACMREWVEQGRPLNNEKVEAFVRALRAVVETDPESTIFDVSWDFWMSSLLLCVELQGTSCETITLVELIYSRCTSRRKLALLDAIAAKLRRPVKGFSAHQCILLKLFHRLLLCTSENIVTFMDEEIAQLLLQGLHVVVEHLESFSAMDSQARWLKQLLVRSSLVRDITLLLGREPGLIRKLAVAMPEPHAVGLMLTMLPLWVREPGDACTFTLIFEKLVDALLSNHVRGDLVEDALVCVDRCVRGLGVEKRHEQFGKVSCFLISLEYSEVQDSLGRLLRLLLCFAVPSTYGSDCRYRLPPTHLRCLEDKLLRQSEHWTKRTAAHHTVVGYFWWGVLRWHAAELPKVVARAVRAVCRYEKRVGSPWDEGHLVAISYSVPSWRSLEKVLEDERRSGHLNYRNLLLHICAGAPRITSGPQQPPQPPVSLCPTTLWLLMRWCTNACARRGLFLATTEVLRSFASDRDIAGGNLLAIPVEEFDALLHTPHVISAQELGRRRMLAAMLSVRLWIATLPPLCPTPGVTELDITGMVARQLQTYWVDYNGEVPMPNEPFGEDSLLLLLCVLCLNRLAGAAKAGDCSHEHVLQETLKKLLEERRGHDPVWQLLYFLETGIVLDHLAAVLVHRFGVAHEVPVHTGAEKYVTSDLPFVGANELYALKELLALREEDPEKEKRLLSVLQLLLQMHGGDVSRAAVAVKAHSLPQWEAYGRCAELAVGVVEHLLTSFPHLEERMHCEGVDVYYLCLLCIQRWLRDPLKLPELARASIDKFMRLGQTAWEGLVSDCLGRHIETLWDAFFEVDGLSSLCAESVILPVSLFWASCLAASFSLNKDV
ncbi:hypothetical protein TraAM80_08485 [Trypanosoma rangeli]|uniref:Uncharacterized protein n=1 Tax=Trypanosoma rangeli TaxID=5698 RepID=A0A422N0G7_TRYRA|nr:uncharacterized protein TraAM80_08485 [Trypanosoma rangeli]RNE98953.1 hypothetical protein TraAM80_08485 [Trypanosoma rangeli]|eukprot:RNE98953.1 hypothetical protein TraAM80_08485 [Trypanosoma rangeli]